MVQRIYASVQLAAFSILLEFQIVTLEYANINFTGGCFGIIRNMTSVTNAEKQWFRNGAKPFW